MDTSSVNTLREPTLASGLPVNLDGKGRSAVLLDWHRTQPRGVLAKPRRQVLSELFTSMFVLSAKCKYRPVVGVSNYLYWIDGEWSLSLIAPAEWSPERRAGFAGTCVLQRDMTWTISPSELLAEENPVSDAICRFYDAFLEMLDTDLTLEEVLPFCIGTIPYYQRLHANAVSRSLRTTLILGNQTSTSCRQWHALLPKRTGEFLTYGA